MCGGCPLALSESGQMGLLGRAQKAPAAPGCPIDFQQAAPFQFLPQRRAPQGKAAGKALTPLAQPSAETQQHLGQQRRPYLPLHRVGRVAEEVCQLEGLLELLEEHLDRPAGPAKVGDGLRAPLQVVGQEDQLAELAVHLDPGHDAAPLDRIRLARRTRQADQVIPEEVPPGGRAEAGARPGSASCPWRG